MQPKDFLDTAEFLIDIDQDDPATQPTEADCRTSVSRAYYASFLDARELLEGMRFSQLHTGNTHHLIRHYLENGGPKARRIANKLSGLHERRKAADYEISLVPTFFTNDAERAIDRAKEIQKLIDECHTDATLKDTVEKAIRRALSL